MPKLGKFERVRAFAQRVTESSKNVAGLLMLQMNRAILKESPKLSCSTVHDFLKKNINSFLSFHPERDIPTVVAFLCTCFITLQSQDLTINNQLVDLFIIQFSCLFFSFAGPLQVDVNLELPPGVKVRDLRWFSVYCRQYNVDFGSFVFPTDLPDYGDEGEGGQSGMNAMVAHEERKEKAKEKERDNEANKDGKRRRSKEETSVVSACFSSWLALNWVVESFNFTARTYAVLCSYNFRE